jgi:hypothetical protein
LEVEAGLGDEAVLDAEAASRHLGDFRQGPALVALARSGRTSIQRRLQYT